MVTIMPSVNIIQGNILFATAQTSFYPLYITRSVSIRYANSYGQYGGGYGGSGSRGNSSYNQWYRGNDSGYTSGGPSSAGGGSPIGGPSSASRISSGYHRSPSRDEGSYGGGRDHHHHRGSPAYGRGSSRGPIRSYSSGIQSSGGGPIYNSQQVRGTHNYHPYAR